MPPPIHRAPRFQHASEHLGLLVLGMADGVHAEFAKEQRFFFRQVLQACQVALEIRSGDGGKR